MKSAYNTAGRYTRTPIIMIVWFALAIILCLGGIKAKNEWSKKCYGKKNGCGKWLEMFKSRQDSNIQSTFWESFNQENKAFTYTKEATYDKRYDGEKYLKCRVIASNERRVPSDTSHPIISIITTVHNPNMQQFDETIQCFLAQTMTNWEWILVNDFSENKNALKDVVKTDPRFVYVETAISYPDRKRGNLGFARHVGVEIAKSDYVIFVDSDDLIDPTTLEKMLYYLDTHDDAHFVTSYIVGFDAKQYKWTRSVNPSIQFKTENVASAMAMFRKKTLLSLGGYPYREGGMEDWKVYLKFANAGKWGHTIPEFLTWYRRREDHTDRWKDLTAGGIKTFIKDELEGLKNLRTKSDWPKPPEKSSDPLELRNPIILNLGDNAATKVNSMRLILIMPYMIVGGSQRLNLVLLQSMKKLGWQITIITTLPSKNAWFDAFRDVTYDIFILSNIGPFSAYLQYASNIISSRRPDVVMVTNSAHGYTMLPYLREAFPLCAFVDYNHIEALEWRKGGYPRFSSSLDESLDLHFTASRRIRNLMIKWGVPQVKLNVAYVGIELDKWKPDAIKKAAIRAKLGYNENDMVILYSCRIVPQKQPLLMAHTAVRVLSKIADGDRKHDTMNNVTIKFMIVGDGPLLQEMQKVLSQLPAKLLENIRFYYSVPYSDAYDVTLASDIAFLPSVMEGIPTSFFEAMSVGNVIVGANVGAISELVKDGVTGTLLTPDRQVLGRVLVPGESRFNESVAFYSQALLNLCSDKSMYSRMSSAALSNIQQFDFSRTANAIVTKLRNTANNVKLVRANVSPSQTALNARAIQYKVTSDKPF